MSSAAVKPQPSPESSAPQAGGAKAGLEAQGSRDDRDQPPWRTDPDFLKTREVLRGVVMMSPRPAPPHALVASSLGVFLMGPYHHGQGGGPGGWWILDEPELHLGPEELSPDLAGWRRSRMTKLPSEAYFSLAPDWVCEILSPSTEDYDRVEKLEIYAENKVQHVWLADPILCTLEVLRLDASGAYYNLLKAYRGRRVVNPEPFDALPLDLARIWPE